MLLAERRMYLSTVWNAMAVKPTFVAFQEATSGRVDGILPQTYLSAGHNDTVSFYNTNFFQLRKVKYENTNDKPRTCIVQLTLGRDQLRIVNIHGRYRGLNIETRLKHLAELLRKLRRCGEKCLIIGDFNIPNDRTDELVQSRRLKDTFTVSVIPGGITKRMDYIIHTNTISIQNPTLTFYEVPALAIDHPALTADVIVNASRRFGIWSQNVCGC